MTTVTYLRNFREDRRISMELYGDNLHAAVNALEDRGLRLCEFRPRPGTGHRVMPDRANMKMRAARYLDYPRQVKSLESDIYHIVDHGYAHLMRQLDPARVVVSIHDVIPLLMGRGLVAGIDAGRRKWLAEYSNSFLKRAAMLIADSESTRRDIIEYCGCEPDRVEVAHLGLNQRYRPLEPAEKIRVRSELGLPGDDTPLVLITGESIYKNQKTSVKVMEQLWSSGADRVRLVRLGIPSANWTDALKYTNHSERIIQLDYLPDDDVARLYNAVDCLLFPSWYEGFGWPPLEAMASGTPVVTSNRASLPEVVGDAAPTFEADDVEGMAAAIESLLYDPQYREAQIQRGLRQADKFNWKNTATKISNVYSHCLEGR